MEVEKIVPIVPEGGNTKTPSSTKKQISPSKNWCFTFNNYDDSSIVPIVPLFSEKCKKWYFAKEVGESGTPHLQGTVEFKTKLRPRSLGLDNRIHWEKRKGTWDEAYTYCMKEDGEKFFGGFRPKRPLKPLPCENLLYPWQEKLLDIIKKEPDDRTIYWIWDESGNVGKTTFMKYLMRFHGAIPLEGKKNDILHVATEHESDLYIYDIERSLESYVSYGSIEKIKNGCWMSGKYEGGIVDRNNPHLIVFANFSPDTEKLSLDRWFIKKIIDLDM